jgi:hypothetical protein
MCERTSRATTQVLLVYQTIWNFPAVVLQVLYIYNIVSGSRPAVMLMLVRKLPYDG